MRRRAADDQPIAGTRLMREYQGVEHTVTVLQDGYEWQGRPYKSLSAIARAITGTRWNGLVFFGLKNRRASSMSKPPIRKLRCAIYTRKSTEEGLDMEFNSLDAQREACSAYIASQRAEGWVELAEPVRRWRLLRRHAGPARPEAPARRHRARPVDVVVVYKIDRLSRSLMDFAKLVEVFDRNDVTFVSVTQSFNTTTSMGRLTLNILLSFAQFEREVIGERIRDKVAASRKRGMWMGGFVPLGYRVEDRKLVINEPEAAIVRMIFERFLEARLGDRCSPRSLADGRPQPARQARSTRAASTGSSRNRVYIGDAVHKGDGLSRRARSRSSAGRFGTRSRRSCSESPRMRAGRTRAATPALLKGLIFGPTGRAMSPTHTRRGNKLYRYYVSQAVLKAWPGCLPGARVPAAEIEAAVIDQLRGMLRSPEIIVATWRAARRRSRACPKARSARRWSGWTRCGTSCSPPSRRASSSCWSSGSTSA